MVTCLPAFICRPRLVYKSNDTICCTVSGVKEMPTDTCVYAYTYTHTCTLYIIYISCLWVIVCWANCPGPKQFSHLQSGIPTAQMSSTMWLQWHRCDCVCAFHHVHNLPVTQEGVISDELPCRQRNVGRNNITSDGWLDTRKKDGYAAGGLLAGHSCWYDLKTSNHLFISVPGFSLRRSSWDGLECQSVT